LKEKGEGFVAFPFLEHYKEKQGQEKQVELHQILAFL